MSSLISHITTNPYGKEDECALFTVADVEEQFTIFDVTTEGQKYTFGFWVKSDSDGLLSIHGTTIATTTQWQQHTVTFIAEGANLVIDYDAPGTYYIYHPKLELGGLATDWTLAPEDVEENIKNAVHEAENAKGTAEDLFRTAQLDIGALRNTISTLVVDENGASMMEQTSTGWTFSMADTKEELGRLLDSINTTNDDLKDTNDAIADLKGSVDDYVEMANYVRVKLDDELPQIILGEEGGDFKVVITNKAIDFLEGTTKAAYISNQSLNIPRAVIENELQQGGFKWVVRKDINGKPRNMGLVWKGDGV